MLLTVVIGDSIGVTGYLSTVRVSWRYRNGVSEYHPSLPTASLLNVVQTLRYKLKGS